MSDAVAGGELFGLGEPIIYEARDGIDQHLDVERFFDHVIRSSESYAEKWSYVQENPVRAGLVVDASDWPYSGEITIIEQR